MWVRHPPPASTLMGVNVKDCDSCCMHRVPGSVFNDGFRESWQEVCCECGNKVNKEREVESSSYSTPDVSDHGPHHPLKNMRVYY